MKISIKISALAALIVGQIMSPSYSTAAAGSRSEPLNDSRKIAEKYFPEIKSPSDSFYYLRLLNPSHTPVLGDVRNFFDELGIKPTEKQVTKISKKMPMIVFDGEDKVRRYIRNLTESVKLAGGPEQSEAVLSLHLTPDDLESLMADIREHARKFKEGRTSQSVIDYLKEEAKKALKIREARLKDPYAKYATRDKALFADKDLMRSRKKHVTPIGFPPDHIVHASEFKTTQKKEGFGSGF